MLLHVDSASSNLYPYFEKKSYNPTKTNAVLKDSICFYRWAVTWAVDDSGFSPRCFILSASNSIRYQYLGQKSVQYLIESSLKVVDVHKTALQALWKYLVLGLHCKDLLHKGPW